MKSKTDSFVCELPLKVKPTEAKTLDKRLEAGRCLYNTVLGESLKRLFLMRQSKEYRQIRDIKDKTLNNKAYREIRERYGFREYDLHREVTKARKSWIGHHLDVHTAQ